MAAALTQ